MPHYRPSSSSSADVVRRILVAGSGGQLIDEAGPDIEGPSWLLETIVKADGTPRLRAGFAPLGMTPPFSKNPAAFAAGSLVGVRLKTYRGSEPEGAFHLYRLGANSQGEHLRLRQLGSALPGNKANYQLDAASYVAPYASVPWNDSGVTAIGGALGATVNAATYTGSYGSTTTANRGVQYTTPANTTRIGLRTAFRSNGGLVGVQIDGSKTAANMLPTAQDLIDRGQADTGILTFFASSDRVLDLEAAANVNSSVGGPTTDIFNAHVPLWEGAAGSHTVKLTHSAKKNLGNSNTSTMYVDAFTYGDDTTAYNVAGYELLARRRAWHTARSAAEYAFRTLPSGTSTPSLVGNFHGYDEQLTLRVLVDGAEVSPVLDGSMLTGQNVTIIKTGRLYHPDDTSTPWATTKTVYEITPLGVTTAWMVSPTRSVTFMESYAMMLPVEGRVFTRGWHSLDSHDYTISVADNFRPDTLSPGVTLWDPVNDDLAVQAWIPETSWSLGPMISTANEAVGIQDSVTSTASGAPNSKLNKVYWAFATGTTPKTYGPGDVIMGLGCRRMALITGATAALSLGAAAPLNTYP